MIAIYNDIAIMTIADSIPSAIAQFEEDTGEELESLNGFYLSSITGNLAAHVEEYGGVGISWGELPDGRLCTTDEEECGEGAPHKFEVGSRLEMTDQTGKFALVEYDSDEDQYVVSVNMTVWGVFDDAQTAAIFLRGVVRLYETDGESDAVFKTRNQIMGNEEKGFRVSL